MRPQLKTEAYSSLRPQCSISTNSLVVIIEHIVNYFQEKSIAGKLKGKSIRKTEAYKCLSGERKQGELLHIFSGRTIYFPHQSLFSC